VTPSKKGKVIVFEGGDGTGKSTQACRLKDFLIQKGLHPLHIREPGSTPVGEQIRKILIAETDGSALDLTPETELLLFMACRAQLFKTVVSPAIEKNRIVLLERSYFSTYAYQGAGLGLDGEWILKLGRWSCSGIEFSRVILLDMEVSSAVSRIGKKLDRVEKRGQGFHEKVRLGFLTLARRFPDLIRVVNAEGNIEEVEIRIHAELRDIL
jgi:dTMP kinase